MGLGFFLGGASEGVNQSAKNLSDILTQDKQRQLYGIQAGKLLREQQAGEEIAKLNQQGVLLPSNPPQKRISPNHPIYDEADLSNAILPNTQGGISYSTSRDNPFLTGGMSDLSVNQQPLQTAPTTTKPFKPQFPELDRFDTQIKQFDDIVNIYNSKGLPDIAKTYLNESNSLKKEKLQYVQNTIKEHTAIASTKALPEIQRMNSYNISGFLIDKVFGDGKTFKKLTVWDEEAKKATQAASKIINSTLSGEIPLATALAGLAALNEGHGQEGQQAAKTAIEFMDKAQTMQQKEELKITTKSVHIGDKEFQVKIDQNGNLVDYVRDEKGNPIAAPRYKPDSGLGSEYRADKALKQKANTISQAMVNVLRPYKSKPAVVSAIALLQGGTMPEVDTNIINSMSQKDQKRWQELNTAYSTIINEIAGIKPEPNPIAQGVVNDFKNQTPKPQTPQGGNRNFRNFRNLWTTY